MTCEKLPQPRTPTGSRRTHSAALWAWFPFRQSSGPCHREGRPKWPSERSTPSCRFTPAAVAMLGRIQRPTAETTPSAATSWKAPQTPGSRVLAFCRMAMLGKAGLPRRFCPCAGWSKRQCRLPTGDAAGRIEAKTRRAPAPRQDGCATSTESATRARRHRVLPHGRTMAARGHSEPAACIGQDADALPCMEPLRLRRRRSRDGRRWIRDATDLWNSGCWSVPSPSAWRSAAPLHPHGELPELDQDEINAERTRQRAKRPPSGKHGTGRP